MPDALAIDLERIRADTPHCEQLIHFNNAGAALSPRIVTEAQINHLRLEQEIGGYEAATSAQAQQARFYTAFAELLNCQPCEIAFLENATRAWHAAFHALNLQAGDHIITADMEYASNYLDLLHSTKHRGLELTTVPSDPHGVVDLDALRAAIRPTTRLVCLTHVPSQRGDIQPAEEVGAIAREHGLWYLLDACQAAGQVVLDVEKIGCDLLCGTGRKYLRGPRGTGFLYARNSRLEELVPAVVDLHSVQWASADSYSLHPDATRFENWERNVAAMIGLATAVDYALSLGSEAIEQRVRYLGRLLHDRLADSHNIRVHEASENLSGIVTFNRSDLDAESTKQRLNEAGINTSISRGANAQLDLGKKGLDVNRASVHYYNTEAEIERFVAVATA